MQTPSHNRIELERRIIGIYKIVTGSAEFLFGSALIIMSAAGLQHLVTILSAEELREDPNDFMVLFVQHHVPALISAKIGLAATLILIGSIKVTGGIGFLMKKNWGYDMLVGLLVILLPLDIARSITNFSVLFGIFVIAHLNILYLLIKYRKDFHTRHGVEHLVK